MPRQGSGGLRQVSFHSGKGVAGMDQTGQRLDPRQALDGPPAARKKDRLPPQRTEEARRPGLVAARQKKRAVIDHPDQPPRGQVRRPARPLALAKARDPVMGPCLRAASRRPVADGGQIVKPGKPVKFRFEPFVGRGNVP